MKGSGALGLMGSDCDVSALTSLDGATVEPSSEEVVHVAQLLFGDAVHETGVLPDRSACAGSHWAV